MAIYNTWLPGGKYYLYPSTDGGKTSSSVRTSTAEITSSGFTNVVQTLVIDDGNSGWGTTFDMTFPAFTMNQPPRIAYTSTANLSLLLRDSDGWTWKAPMRAQNVIAGANVTSYERGWAWNRFLISGAPSGNRAAYVNITNGGRGYTEPPSVTFSKPPESGTAVQAQGYAVLTDDVVTSIVITTRGCNYATAPTVSIGPPASNSLVKEQATADAYIEYIDPLDYPTEPATGAINLFQLQLADGVTGPANIVLYYITGRRPTVLSTGNIKTFKLTTTDPRAFKLNVGDFILNGGERQPINYLGSLPFGYMVGGPSRYRQSSAPYRGPYIAGYQDGTPWAEIKDLNAQENLSGMMDFMLDAQAQFVSKRNAARVRIPGLVLDDIIGPFMHCYLPATWDSLQTGTIDTWIFEAPDGNPAWTGWQWRAYDSMCKTWYSLVTNSVDSTSAAYTLYLSNLDKAETISTRFTYWLYDWFLARPDVNYVPSGSLEKPSEWAPQGWSLGDKFPTDLYLDPLSGATNAHDLALALKGAIFSSLSGADSIKCKYIMLRCMRALRLIQVVDTSDPMYGAFSLSPKTFQAYGFEQGEIQDALALALQHKDLFSGMDLGDIGNLVGTDFPIPKPPHLC